MIEKLVKIVDLAHQRSHGRPYFFCLIRQLSAKLLQLINGPFEAHFAQDDCEALLQVCMAYGQEFIDYVDAKAAPFPYHVIANSTITLS